MKTKTNLILLFLLAVALLLGACHGSQNSTSPQPEPHRMHFKADGTFKIAQFTDVHWTGSEPEKCADAARVIRHVLETERPDLAVLTGDIVISPQEAGWKAVMALFSEAKVPVAVVLGNHDDEEEWTREQIFSYLETLPGFMGQRGPKEVPGVGNYIIELYAAALSGQHASASGTPNETSAGSPDSVATSNPNKISAGSPDSSATRSQNMAEPDQQDKSSLAHQGSAGTDSLAALLYFFDSNAYCDDKTISNYGWIHFDQIAWYRQQSRHYTAANLGNPYPALAFFHIPLPEYAVVQTQKETMGSTIEEICSPQVNTGLLASIIEMKDIMGTFVGHDHNNNFIGVHKGIALAYGQKTGFSSYTDLPKGARIIELHQGQREFNTWIRTEEGSSCHYNYPLGASFRLEDLHLKPAIEVESVRRGLRFNYFRGNFKDMAGMLSTTPIKRGTTETITLSMAEDEDGFGLEFTGVIRILTPGMYRFYTHSDDGSRLFIGDSLVVDNDGSHSAQRAQGMIALAAGLHPFRLLYFEDHAGQSLEVGYAGPGIREQPLPDAHLFYPIE